MVSIANWSPHNRGSSLNPDKKWDPAGGCGQKETHDKSFNWNDPADGLWDKLLQRDLN